jgi:uncharacterized protein with NAD-binding domain and iron-sulfur cluster
MDVKGLPCWPEHPLTEHLQPQETPDGVDFESFWAERDDRDRVILRDGRDFDQIVFAISVGMIPYICQELLDHSSAWREVAENLGTVATQSVQLWLTRDERDLGWVGDAGDIVSGFTEPFDTWASMSHLIDAEDWPSDARPGSIAYFCSCLSDDVATEPATASAQVLESARDFLDREVKALWPGAVGPSGFRWDLLCGPSGKDAMALGALDGGTRLRTQYWRANIDPSDRYVQSLPGTARFRIAPGSTGFANLVVAGDWTDCGLNAGCLEAATLSGQLAAAALLQRAEQR